MDRFRFTEDDPSLFWDTAIPLWCKEIGVEGEGVSIFVWAGCLIG
jgi:hypothetical protein